MYIVKTLYHNRRKNRERLDLTLTHVCYLKKQWGKEYYTAIPLQQISSISFKYSSSVSCLILSIIFALIGIGSSISALQFPHIVEELSGAAIISGGIFLFFLLVYLTTKKQIMVLESSSDKILVDGKGFDRDLIRRFVHKVKRQQINLIQFQKDNETINEPEINQQISYR